MNIDFSQTELRDLGVAWLALGLAFAIFFERGATGFLQAGIVVPLVVSLLTAGVGFILHELAHKVVAVRYDQIAEFRADYNMLFVAIMSAIVGFLFAAPGAVHHRGYLTDRQHGLIAFAGPVMNLVLVVVFAPLLVAGIVLGSPLLELIGGRGLAINFFLAAFNLVPIGSLDGKTVMGWNKLVWAGTFVPSAVLAFVIVFVYNIGF
ncbi:Zn-dependent protease (includes SpoIVFB) [Halogranum gelatinilyticum]|uniref:Zn-dependent protease (Includes SpoIVFB) n=1 Tax=Halogranum gelatinilyticum TaxID=660521 RepID=A0A1G9W3K3_9EURY|nr:metalloprotease [Halogranum gelatinilyticum]SDM79070.1 Zn-dependent protease (includes SpoIVFB) [Halogranum gelatinilyticum]